MATYEIAGSSASSEAEVPPSSSRILVVIAGVMLIATLRLGRMLVLPIVISVMLTLTLGAPVRWLQRKRIPGRLAAALVVFGALGAGVGVATALASPAVQWAASAPATIKVLEAKIRRIMNPFTALQQSADRMQQAAAAGTGNAPRTVQLATPGILARLSVDSVAIVPATFSVIFLTYFLLANGPLVRRKLAGLRPGRPELERREHLLGEIELAASHFLVTVALINTGVGAITTLALWAVGVPNPLLWGGIAAVLNFVPYLGPMVTVAIIALAALATIGSTGHALLAPAAFLVVHLTESNLVTPLLLGRHLPVNTVAIFLGLLFFGWMWGIPGAVLAVPLTVCVKLVCDHVPALSHVGELLDN
ncbi:MAG TPA: AI-2E family transporter [Gemmatimonadaceae bacterium]|nr:AI-2E family transporter [Gemmatimonadaceae bacterium]